MGSIYIWTNIVNGKKYIGKCHGDVNKRTRNHISGHGSVLLKRAFDKYGLDNFTFEILHDGIPDEFLNDYEMQAIKMHNSKVPNGYNLTDGGEGIRGYNHTRVSRDKMSKSHTGKKIPEETKREWSRIRKAENLSAETRRRMRSATAGENNPMYGRTGENHPFYGRKHTPEAKEKISQASTGRTPTPEACRKMSESSTGKTHTEETKQKISQATAGENNPMYGRKHSEETKRKIAKANETPALIEARKIFESLPAEMPLAEKRKHLRETFPSINPSQIWYWCQKFDTEMSQ